MIDLIMMIIMIMMLRLMVMIKFKDDRCKAFEVPFDVVTMVNSMVIMMLPMKVKVNAEIMESPGGCNRMTVNVEEMCKFLSY